MFPKGFIIFLACTGAFVILMALIMSSSSEPAQCQEDYQRICLNKGCYDRIIVFKNGDRVFYHKGEVIRLECGEEYVIRSRNKCN